MDSIFFKLYTLYYDFCVLSTDRGKSQRHMDLTLHVSLHFAVGAKKKHKVHFFSIWTSVFQWSRKQLVAYILVENQDCTVHACSK